MYVCILNQAGDVLVHQNMKARPEALLQAIAPYRDDRVVAVEGMFPGDWRADLWARDSIPFVLGHALYRQASPGGKAKTDTIDAHKSAGLLRGGLLPQAYGYPAEMRATRDWLRRRMYLTRKRAELLVHVQNTNSQYNLPESGKKLASQANRAGVAERFPAPAVQKSMEVDLALLGYYDQRLSDMDFPIVKAAKQHDAQTLCLLQTGPGSRKILSRVLLYEIHESERFPRGQDCVAYGRLVKWATASAGKRYGTAGPKLGKAFLTWTFSEAAVLFLRENPAGQQSLSSLEKKHRQGTALTVLAQKLARAVYSRLKRQTACDMQKFRRRRGAERASLSPNWTCPG